MFLSFLFLKYYQEVESEVINCFLSHPHQHSSLPPEVTPQLGWLWRMLGFLIRGFSESFLSSNIWTFVQFDILNIICITNAMKAVVRINIGFMNMVIVAKFVILKHLVTVIISSNNTLFTTGRELDNKCRNQFYCIASEKWPNIKIMQFWGQWCNFHSFCSLFKETLKLCVLSESLW